MCVCGGGGGSVSVKQVMEVVQQGSKIQASSRPRILGDQKICEDNHKLRPGCPPDYQIFFVKEWTAKFSYLEAK